MATTITDAQKQAVDFVRQGQQAAVKAVASWTEQTLKLVPAVSGLPFGELYRNPKDAIDGAFEFTKQLLNAQRDFVVGLIEASGVSQIAETKTAGSKTSK